MKNHNATCPKYTTLCNQLFEVLRQKIPGLRIKHEGRLCLMWSTGAAIAWASPVRIWGGIRVSFVGKLEQLKQFPASIISLKTTPITTMWGDCCVSFRISNKAQMAEAAELLSTISYPLTMARLSKDAGAFKASQPQAAEDTNRLHPAAHPLRTQPSAL
jgi:hypothetical protein